jgi:hypothetical protein
VNERFLIWTWIAAYINTDGEGDILRFVLLLENVFTRGNDATAVMSMCSIALRVDLMGGDETYRRQKNAQGPRRRS